VARIQERKAAKDYPANGIKKGDKYFYVKIKTGPYSSRTIRSLKCPKRYELTTSDFYSTLWRIEDEGFDGVEDGGSLRDVAEEVRELGGEQQEKFDNMPDGLQQGDTGQLVEERANQCEEWADAIEQAAQALEEALEQLDASAQAWIDYNKAVAEFEEAGGEGDEPDEPDASLPDNIEGTSLTDDDAVQEARNEIIAEKVQEAQDANPGIS
jgi:uncharacterized protein YukE